MTEQFWLDAIDRFGLPTAILIFVAVGIVCVWKYLTKDGGWFETLKDGVKGIFSLMRDFVEGVAKQGEQNSVALTDARAFLTKHHEACQGNTRMLRNLHAGAIEACDSLEAMVSQGEFDPKGAKDAIERVRAVLSREN